MTKILDFDSKRQVHLFKKKEEKVDALRKAFRQAREESATNAPRRKGKNRSNSKKNNRKNRSVSDRFLVTQRIL